MRSGAPFHQGIADSYNAEHPLLMLWRMQFTERRTCEHWVSGLPKVVETQTEFEEFWGKVKTIVPAKRRFHWNMKKHGYKDLCKFLNITGKTFCEREGLLPNSGINVMNHERDNPKSFLIVACYLFILHYPSYHI